MAAKIIDEQAFYHPETGELLNGLARSLLSEDGRLEYPDPVPMAAPVDLRPAPSGMRKLVQDLIRQELSQFADSMEMETFEEADDFDIEDDPPDPLTPYEAVFDPKDNAKNPARGAATADAGAGEVAAAASPACPLPANPSAVTNGGPNVKRSESDVASASASPAVNSGPTRASDSAGTAGAD